ncbi:RNA ligase family protein [Aquabacterium sp.]|uniref:RNA ligase family protein n=1 Tax=Aquabacterium sp. TaxID=1872578 RepID=UPI00403805B2
MEFLPFPKIPRLKRSITITEKIDGTNAQVVLSPATGMECVGTDNVIAIGGKSHIGDCPLVMRAGSRSRWITPGKETDNYGFAGWCLRNAEELFKLGEGQHFGEWYGQGIGRSYGLDHRRFALFNVDRWGAHNPNTPACCEVVPIVSRADLADVDRALVSLKLCGSRAVPGFMKPEGVIVYHHAARSMFKVLLENDELPKGLVEA